MEGPLLFMVFDVESLGLHGEGFAVGYVVVNRDGEEKASGRFACGLPSAQGTKAGREWVLDNIPPLAKTHTTPAEVRAAFWGVWREWHSRGALLAADVAWPVEARFLAACVDDVRPRVQGGPVLGDSPREWEGPYPLIDVACVRLAHGFDPLAAYARRDDERPIHDPLADARQSARLLVEVLKGG